MRRTHEHQQIFQTTKNFVEKEINPFVDQWENDHIFPAHQVFKKMGDLGLLGIHYAEKDGGMGLDYSYAMTFAEALGHCTCAGIPMAIGVQSFMATPALARYGSDELKRNWLAPTMAGDLVVSLGVSEAGAGSDVAGLKTTARREGDEYVINGSKMWITNGMQSDWICLLANTSDGKPHLNKSMIVVPMDAKGITKQKIHKIGMWSSDTAQIFFDNVRVPVKNLIGMEGMGFLMQMQQFQVERLFGAASGLVGMDNIIKSTIEYTRQRHTFGQPIIDNQSVHFKLAELQTEVECLRALVYQTTERLVANPDDMEVVKLASMAKLKVGRLSREVATDCLQYWGGMGFTWDNLVSRAYRDVRLVSIGGGADEIMLGIICKLMNILPSKKK